MYGKGLAVMGRIKVMHAELAVRSPKSHEIL